MPPPAPSPHQPDKLVASELIRASDVRATEDQKDQAARRWAGVVVLGAVLLLSLGLILIRPPGTEQSDVDRAWNIVFTVLGYAGGYIFQSQGRRRS